MLADGSFPKKGYLIWGPHNKDSILGSILGSPTFRKLPDLGVETRMAGLQAVVWTGQVVDD